MDIREELYDVKKQLAERERELGEQREMLKDYISNRVQINYLNVLKLVRVFLLKR